MPGQFQPGPDPRRATTGRPKGYTPFAYVLRRALAKTDRRDKSQMEKIADKVVALAMKGDMDAVRWIADRVDGKVAQQMNVTSEQTVHVVPWLPALREAVNANDALPGEMTQETIDVEATSVEEVVEAEADDGR